MQKCVTRPGAAIRVCGWALVVCTGAIAAGGGAGTMQDRQVIAGAPAALFSDAVSAGGFVFVSSLSAPPPRTGSAPALSRDDGDVGAQTRAGLAHLRDVLERAGSSLAQTVSVFVRLRRASDFDAMNAAYRDVFADAPPTRTTVVTDLPQGELVSLSAIAVPTGAARETMRPAGWMKSPRPYSTIVRANGFVFLSGLVSRRGSDDAVVPGPLPTQIRTILDNAGTLLRTAGVDFGDVVASRVYLTDESYYDEMNAEYAKYFPTEPPARAVAVTGLMGSDAAVEITLIASESGKQVLGASVSPSLPLSTATRAGRFTFLSGVLGTTDTNAPDLPAQTREAVARVTRTLTANGLSMADVVDATTYLPDVWQQDRLASTLRELLPSPPPAGGVVGARLASRAALVELLATAWH